MPLLSDAQIQDRLVKLDGWELKGAEIERTYKFKDFAEAMLFVNRVAELAEAANHHPDIAISWNEVKLALATHSQGGVTENDFALAQQINSASAHPPYSV